MIKNGEDVLNNFKHHGGWHKKRSYDYVYVAGLMTGCGIAQMYGITSVLGSEHRLIEFQNETLPKIIQDYKKDGVGGIICTLGQDYYKYEKNLLSLGFILLYEYHNYRHGDSYTQKLYILTY